MNIAFNPRPHIDRLVDWFVNLMPPVDYRVLYIMVVFCYNTQLMMTDRLPGWYVFLHGTWCAGMFFDYRKLKREEWTRRYLSVATLASVLGLSLLVFGIFAGRL